MEQTSTSEIEQQVTALINRLRATREAWGLSIDDLSEIIGVNKRTVYAWEAFERTPRVHELFRWARCLGLDISVNMRR